MNSKTLIKTSGKSLKRLYGTTPLPKVIRPAVKKKSSLKSTKAAKKCSKKTIANLSQNPTPPNLTKILKMFHLSQQLKGNSIAEPSGNDILPKESVIRKNYWNS